MEEMEKMEKTVGIIGLGQIGLPIAVNLMNSGFTVHGYRRGSMDEFAKAGGRPAASPRKVAETCEYVITCLPDADAAEEVIDGASGLAKAGRNDLVVIELSTLKIKEKERLLAAMKAAGGMLLDCPLSGVPEMVRKRAAVIFASGEKAAYERVQAVFEGMTDKAFYLGGFGVGSRMKFVANLLVGVHILVTAEAMALGAKAGLSPELMVKVLSPSAASSLQFQTRAPLMAEKKWEPALAPHTILFKDLVTIAEFADALGCPTPLLHTARDYFAKAIEEGLESKDVASIYEVVSKECGLGWGTKR